MLRSLHCTQWDRSDSRDVRGISFAIKFRTHGAKGLYRQQERRLTGDYRGFSVTILPPGSYGILHLMQGPRLSIYKPSNFTSDWPRSGSNSPPVHFCNSYLQSFSFSAPTRADVQPVSRIAYPGKVAKHPACFSTCCSVSPSNSSKAKHRSTIDSTCNCIGREADSGCRAPRAAQPGRGRSCWPPSELGIAMKDNSGSKRAANRFLHSHAQVLSAAWLATPTTSPALSKTASAGACLAASVPYLTVPQ